MCVTGNHDQAGRHSCHAIPGRHSGKGRRCTLAACTGMDGYPGLRCHQGRAILLLSSATRKTPIRPQPWLLLPARAATSRPVSGMGIRVHLKKLIVGAKGMCASSCALIWMGGETGRKFIYRNQGTGLCFHQAFNPVAGPPGHVLPGPPSGSGNAFISKYLADLDYNQDMIVWATIADPQHRLCLNPGLAEKKFHIDFWYNTEDGQHYTLPGNHGLLPPAPPAPLLSQGDGATPLNPSLPNGWSLSLLPLAPPVSPLSQGELTPPAAPLTYDVWYWSAPTQKWVTEDWVLTSEGCMKRVQQIYDDVTHPPFCRLHPKGD